MTNEQEVKIGEYYHFWDDGKTSMCRHFICKCEKVISIDESKKVMYETAIFNEDPFNIKKQTLSLYKIWELNKKHYKSLFDDNTPYFIVCSCPKFSNNDLLFAKGKHGDWFGMDIHTCWEGGELDINSLKFNNVINFWQELLDDNPDDGYAAEAIKQHKNVKY